MIAEHTNDALEKAGHDARVDARSYKELAIDQVPTVHQGKEATALIRNGERTRLGDKQKVAQALNGSLASAAIQRAPDDGQSGMSEHGRGEDHEETRRRRNAPEPVAPARGIGTYPQQQRGVEREPER